MLCTEMSNVSLERVGWLGAAITLAVGFLPFLVLSLMTDTFWPRSHVSVPLSLSPSILIGDSLLIPLFNWYATPILFKALRSPLPSSTTWRIRVLALLSLLVSTSVNIALHISWTKDAYTGFIDPTLGKLSLGGEWHCLFASVELAFILCFVSVCALLHNDSKRIVPREVLNAWKILIAYTTLPIADAVVMVVIVGRRFSDFSLADFTVLSSLLFGGLTYAFLSRMLKG
jgi:hypothetical protein